MVTAWLIKECARADVWILNLINQPQTWLDLVCPDWTNKQTLIILQMKIEHFNCVYCTHKKTLISATWESRVFLVFLPCVRLVNCRFHLFRSSASFFNSQYHQLTVLFFSLLFSLQSSVLQWHREEGNFFWEYDQYKWIFYEGYYLEVSSSPLYVQETPKLY